MSALNGILELSWWGVVLAVLAMTHITIMAVTVFLHRHMAHRALELHPVLSHFFRFWLWLTTGMVTRAWTAIHRKHHARCETEDDPHSPQIMGIRKVLLEGAELYRREARNAETLEKYGHGTPDDWLERKVYGRHSRLGIGLMLLIDAALFGPIGITVWAVQMVWIPFLAAGVINGIGHYWGYRNFETPDAATNIVPWGVIIGGEELHNNHHAFPASAKLSSKSWEFDIGWLYIRLFAMLGLARVRKVAPAPMIVAGADVIDLETLRAVIVNRFHVLSHYAREVIVPVLREELGCVEASRRGWFRRARNLLVREPGSMDVEMRLRLDALLERSQSLRTVYQHKLALQQLWARSTLPQEGLLQALQSWCQMAEATGNRYLQDFARRLRGYRLQAV